MMRVGILGASTSLASAGIVMFACGTQLAAPSDDARDAAADATEPAELPLEDFGCGPAARCRVNVQVCCIVANATTCAAIADGCTAFAADAGGVDGGDAAAAPAPKPLQCTTYRVCNASNTSSNDCCWSEAQGSSCKNDCEADELRLCQQGDGCGTGYSCVQIAGDPLGPGIGRCAPDGSSSSGGSSGWGGSGWGGSSGFN